MSGATYFIQSCPTCSRRLQIRIEHIGKEVSCCHCSARFIADSMPSNAATPCATDLIARADQLLEGIGAHEIASQTLLTY